MPAGQVSEEMQYIGGSHLDTNTDRDETNVDAELDVTTTASSNDPERPNATALQLMDDTTEDDTPSCWTKELVMSCSRFAALFFLVIFPWIGAMHDSAQQRTLAILLAAVVSWLAQLLPIAATAMLIGPFLVLYGVTTPEQAFYPYADPLLFLFYGAFFMAKSMQRHGLDRRLGEALWRSKVVGGVGWRLRLAAMSVGGLLSMWISNTATAAMLIPIVQKIGGNDPAGTTGSILAVAYACSIGGTATIIGTPPNLISLRLLEHEGILIDFVMWLQIGVPVAVTLILLVYVMFFWLHPLKKVRGERETADSTTDDPSYTQLSAALPPPPPPRDWTRGEVITIAAFSIGLVGWLTAPVIKLIAGDGSDAAESARKTLHVGVVAMLASSILFFTQDTNGEAILPWSEASKVDWGIIMLFGGGISLGTAMKETGLAETLGSAFIDATGVTSLWAVTVIFTTFTVFFTEVCSNTASANILVPLVIGVCKRLSISPVPPCIGVALAASCAFMMPISTGPNAVAFSTGNITLGSMARTGIMLNLASTVALFVLLRFLCPLYGWDELRAEPTTTLEPL